MNTLIIYDNTGFIISTMGVGAREPQGGVQFLWVDIPLGKRIKIIYNTLSLIDVSVTPNVAILEDIPKTIEELNIDRITATENAITELMFPM